MPRANASVEIVLTELRTGIQRGRYAPGQRLITSELASQMKTSLAPVREALHLLIGEGLVEMRPIAAPSVRTLTAQTFIDGLQVLEVVGGLALRLIAPKLKDASVRRTSSRLWSPFSRRAGGAIRMISSWRSPLRTGW